MSGPAPAKKRSGPKVDLDATRERLVRLGLVHAAEQLEGELSEAVKHQVSPHRVLDRLLDEELTWGEERRIRTALRLSGLPPGQTLGNFDFGFQPAIDRSQIETLGTCSWIRERYNLLLQGPPLEWARRTWGWPWGCRPSNTASRWDSSAWRSCWLR